MHQQPAQLLIALLLIISCSFTAAQIYKTTDDKGNPAFTDNPNAGATPVELEPTNTVKPINITPATAEASVDDSQPYQTLAISSPENEAIIANGLVPTTVSANIDPALELTHQLRLLLDGSIVSSGQSTRFVIPTLDRGEHSLQLEVIEGDKVIQQSAPISLFAYRPGGKR